MITRPLDLASRMRPEPRNFDWLFYVNVAVLVVFFAFFGSDFVLAPGLSVRLPSAAGADANAKPATHFITVLATGQIYTAQGTLKLEQVETWLSAQARATKAPVLLIRGDATVPVSVITMIGGAAAKAGFADVMVAVVDATDGARTEER